MTRIHFFVRWQPLCQLSLILDSIVSVAHEIEETSAFVPAKGAIFCHKVYGVIATVPALFSAKAFLQKPFCEDPCKDLCTKNPVSSAMWFA